MVSGVDRDDTSSGGGSSLTSLKGRVVAGQPLSAHSFLQFHLPTRSPAPRREVSDSSAVVISSSNPCIANSGGIIEGAEVLEAFHQQHHRSLNPQSHQEDDQLGQFRRPPPIPGVSPAGGRPGRRPPPGPGSYHRTLSSSSLLSNKVQVAKSRSEYCGINQVCHSGSNCDLLLHNANFSPNIRNNLSRSGNIVYGCGGGGTGNHPGISFVDSGFIYDKEAGGGGGREIFSRSVTGHTTACPQQGSSTPGPPPPDRRHLVRGLSRNAFHVPSTTQLQYHEQQFYWQKPAYPPTAFEQQHLQQQAHYPQNLQQHQQFAPKVQKRRVGGSHPDISSFASGPVLPAALPAIPQQQQLNNPQQVSIKFPPSPQANRRLLPRIKKTESSTTSAVVVEKVGKGGSGGGKSATATLSSTSTMGGGEDDEFEGCYISSGGGRTPEWGRRELSSSSSSAVLSSPKKKTEPPPHHHHHHQHHHHHYVQDDDFLSIKPPPPPKGMKSTRLQLAAEGVSVSVADVAATKGRGKVKSYKVPSSLTPYYRNAPIKKLKHPLEENIFSSLFITLFAVAVALVVGVPLLCGVGCIVVIAMGCRYLIAIATGVVSYMRFICSNRLEHLSRSQPPNIFPRDRLAFPNDVRWLGRKRASRCQSILHTLLVFEGAMDVSTMRHLIQSRVLRAETPEGELAYPRLLQKLVSATAGYFWELDLSFDIQNHIFPEGATTFSSESQLQQYLGHLLTTSLPLSRPLWEIRLLPSYYGGGKDTMAVLRVHQCLADGMSLIRILSHALADHQQIHVPQRPHFAGMSFGFNVIRSLIVGPVTIFLWWFTTFRDKNLFSIPLPKLRTWRRRKLSRRWRKWWQGWWRRRGGAHGGEASDSEVDDKVSYCSTLSSSSCRGGASSGGSSCSTPTSSSANNRLHHPTNFPRRSPLPSKQVQSSPPSSLRQGGDDLTSQSPPSSLVHHHHSSSAQPSSPRHVRGPVVDSLLSRGVLKTRNLRKCLGGGRRSTSRSSSVKSQHQDGKESPRSKPPTMTMVPTRKRKKKRRKKRKRRRRRGVFGGLRNDDHHISGGGGESDDDASSASSTTRKLASPPVWNVVWSAPISVPKVARVKQIMRSSYNDVLLSAAAGSVRMYLQAQGIPYPGDVQVVIPVDLRNDISSPKQSPRLGCKVASVLATVPSGIESAIPRLWATRHRLDELKASADSVVAYGATTILMNVLPHWLAIPILESITNKASLQFCNLPGPTSTVVIGGYPLKGIYPIYPPPGRIRAAISVFTYADQVHVTVVTHRSLINAGPLLLTGMTEQVDQLSRQLSQRRVPGESRRSTRNFHQANNLEITKPPTRQIQFQLQVVQEELAQLNSRLEAQGIVVSDQDFLLPSSLGRVPAGLSILPSSSSALAPYPPGYPPASVEPSVEDSELSTAGQLELQNRLKSLKNEFAQLIGELRRRSSIVEGIAMSFEDEENEEEYRKPRKRALSVVSMTRRSSIFSARTNAAPESPVYSSDDDLPSSPPPEVRPYPTCSNIRHTSSPMRTTAV